MNELVMQHVREIFNQNISIITKLKGRTNIKVIGIGGGALNIISQLLGKKTEGMTVIAADTDFDALKRVNAQSNIKLGVKTTLGLGANSDPEYGRKAAQESVKDIIGAIEGSDMLVLVACMGGGTGTGATQVIADAAQMLGVFTVGLITKPFKKEGRSRQAKADEAILKLHNNLKPMLLFPNDELIVSGSDDSVLSSFKDGDAIIIDAIYGVIKLLEQTQTQNSSEYLNQESLVSNVPEALARSQKNDIMTCWECGQEFAFDLDSCPSCGKWSTRKIEKDKELVEKAQQKARSANVATFIIVTVLIIIGFYLFPVATAIILVMVFGFYLQCKFPINSDMLPGSQDVVCMHCRKVGMVTRKRVTKKQGISGGKATGAIFTGGFSLLFTGLSQKEKMTEAHCKACNSTWHY